MYTFLVLGCFLLLYEVLIRDVRSQITMSHIRGHEMLTLRPLAPIWALAKSLQEGDPDWK
jgi:hypothetical protein